MANEEALKNIYDRLNKATRFKPTKMTGFTDWATEAGDVVKIKNGDDEYNMPIFSSSMTWNGAPYTTLSSTSDEARDELTDISISNRYSTGRYDDQEETMQSIIGDVTVNTEGLEEIHGSGIWQNRDNITSVVGNFTIDNDGNVKLIDGSGIVIENYKVNNIVKNTAKNRGMRTELTDNSYKIYSLDDLTKDEPVETELMTIGKDKVAFNVYDTTSGARSNVEINPTSINHVVSNSTNALVTKHTSKGWGIYYRDFTKTKSADNDTLLFQVGTMGIDPDTGRPLSSVNLGDYATVSELAADRAYIGKLQSETASADKLYVKNIGAVKTLTMNTGDQNVKLEPRTYAFGTGLSKTIHNYSIVQKSDGTFAFKDETTKVISSTLNICSSVSLTTQNTYFLANQVTTVSKELEESE